MFIAASLVIGNWFIGLQTENHKPYRQPYTKNFKLFRYLPSAI